MADVIVIQSDLRKTEKQRLRVGAYARVSSNSLEQEDSATKMMPTKDGDR